MSYVVACSKKALLWCITFYIGQHHGNSDKRMQGSWTNLHATLVQYCPRQPFDGLLYCLIRLRNLHSHEILNLKKLLLQEKEEKKRFKGLQHNGQVFFFQKLVLYMYRCILQETRHLNNISENLCDLWVNHKKVTILTQTCSIFTFLMSCVMSIWGNLTFSIAYIRSICRKWSINLRQCGLNWQILKWLKLSLKWLKKSKV